MRKLALSLLLLLAPVLHAQTPVIIQGQTRASGPVYITSTPASLPCAITTASEPNGQVGVAYTGAVLTTSNCTAPFTYSVTSGLPPGLSITVGNGQLTGTPTTAGNYQTQISMTDSSSPKQIAKATYTIQIANSLPPPACQITTATEPGGTQGVSYMGNTLATANCTSPLTFTVFSGSIPTGTAMTASNGQVVGTPTVAGTFNFVAKVVDNLGNTAQSSTLSIVIANAPPPPVFQFTAPLNEPSGVVGSAYSSNGATTINGTPPITFSSPLSIPGLSFNTNNGVYSGIPTVAGSYSFVETATDSSNPQQTAQSITLTIGITAATGAADNRYCNTNETINSTALPKDGPAQPLQNCVRTARGDTPSPGATVTVTAGSFTSLNNAITNATCGQTIIVPALTSPGVQAVYTGQLKPTANCPASSWITVETDQMASLPAEGNRISPAWIGIASLPGRPGYSQPTGGAGIFMPKLITTGNTTVIQAQANSSHWRFIGLELTTTAGTTVQNGIITICPSCNHYVFDQDLIHGGNNSQGQDRDTIQVGLRNDGTYVGAVEDYIYDIHCVLGQVCQDNYAIFGGGVSNVQNGPLKAVDNYMEAAGQCFLDGGGGSGSTTQPLVDVEFRRNHCFKPLFWYTVDPSYFGTQFDVKNCFELKNAQRVLLEGDICENEWEGQSDQFGTMVLLGAKNQANGWSGTANTDNAGNVTWVSGQQHFSANQVAATCSIPFECKMTINGATYHVTTFTDSTHVTVTPATPAQTGVAYTAFLPGLNPNAAVTDVTIRYSIFTHASRCIAMFTVPSDGGDIGQGTNDFSIHDIVCDDISTKWVNAAGGCCYWAWGIQVQNDFPSPNNLHDIKINHVDVLAFQNAFTYANGNGGPAFGGGFQQSPTGVVTNLTIENSLGTAGWTGSKSVCNGTPASVLARWQCYDTLNGVPQNTYCLDHNLFATKTQGNPPNNGDTSVPPYPGDLGQPASPGCSFTPTGNQFVTSFAAFQFTNLNGASGGNYQLLSTSPGHNAASDGTDIGVNWTNLQNAIAGVN